MSEVIVKLYEILSKCNCISFYFVSLYKPDLICTYDENLNSFDFSCTTNSFNTSKHLKKFTNKTIDHILTQLCM